MVPTSPRRPTSPSRPEAGRPESLRALIAEELHGARALHAPDTGIALGVLQRGEVATTAAGLRVDERLRACSITKLFTATLLVRLAAEGAVDLDVPVRTWLPELRLADEEVRRRLTTRHLLSHTSGLECELPALERYGVGDDARLRAIADYDELAQLAPLGTVYGYGNAGYWLLGALADRVTATSFESALQAQVIAPLGLERTAVETELTSGAVGHVTVDGRTIADPDSRHMPRVRTPSGGVVSTVEDLLAFGAAHLEGAWGLDAAALREMRRPIVAASSPPGHIGLGFWVGAGGRIAGHQGGYHGFQSQLLLVPEASLAIAALGDGEPAFATIRSVISRLLERLAGGAARAEWEASAARGPQVALGEAEAARLVGSYGLGEDRIDVFFDGSRWSIELEDEGEWRRFSAVATGPSALMVDEPGELAGEELDFPATDRTGRPVARFGGVLLAAS